MAVRLMRRESSFNPYAIGVIGGPPLDPQPHNLQGAIDDAEQLIKAGKKFAIGIAQIHIDNIRTFKLTWRQAFDPCTNLRYGQSILQDFHAKALKEGLRGDDAVLAALRGYNSGNLYATVSDAYAASILGRWQQQSQHPVRQMSSPGRAATQANADDADIFAALIANSTSPGADSSNSQSRDIFEE